MSPLSALEEELRAHPWDWERWLDYAGILAERGDVRGSLIGLERRLATAETPQDKALFRNRIDALTATHQKSWLSPWTAPLGTTIRWHHGFVREICFQRCRDERAVFAALDGLWAHPTGRFLAIVQFRNVRLGTKGAEVLSWSRALGTLEGLYFEATGIGTRGVAALASSPIITSLSQLSLRDDTAGDAGATAIARSEILGSLTALDLGRNRIGDAGAAELARSPTLRSLRTLNLEGNRIGNAGAAAIARSAALCSLTSLNIEKNALGTAGRRALAASTGLRCRLQV